MPVYKDKGRKTWYASFYYTNWRGERKLKKKRGFPLERDAKEFERQFLLKQQNSCNMTFGSLVEIYMEDMKSRLRKSTLANKKFLIEKQILPAFESLPVNEITSAQVRKWQDGLLETDLAQTYIKTINNQLSAVFNYAVKHYHLPENPVRIAGTIGRKNADVMKFWTVDQFNTFLPCVPKLPARAGFSVLFWTGIRIGELLALADTDFNFEKKTLSITKSFQMVDGEEVITDPKTPKSRRIIDIPQSLCDCVKEYMAALYDYHSGDRLWPYTKSFFHQQMAAGCQKCGLEKIRVHDLRHSHAALLIEMEVPILLVSERLGHESVETTWNIYGHLYPNRHTKTVQKLDDLMSQCQSNATETKKDPGSQQ